MLCWCFHKNTIQSLIFHIIEMDCFNAGTPGMKEALHKLMEERWPGEFVDRKWKQNFLI